jgi:hypothetical protein
MKLYPLGTQRDLDTEFDRVDFNGWDGSFSGLLKKYFRDNRRYNGIHIITSEETVEMYYFTFSPDSPTVDISVFTAMGYDHDNLLKGIENPLYICVDVFEWQGLKYTKVSHEEELVKGRVAKKLIKEYLDPFYFKPNKNKYKIPDITIQKF